MIIGLTTVTFRSRFVIITSRDDIEVQVLLGVITRKYESPRSLICCKNFTPVIKDASGQITLKRGRFGIQLPTSYGHQYNQQVTRVLAHDTRVRWRGKIHKHIQRHETYFDVQDADSAELVPSSN